MKKIITGLWVILLLLAALLAALLVGSGLVPGRTEYTQPETVPPDTAAVTQPTAVPQEKPLGIAWEFADLSWLPPEPGSSGTYYYISGYRESADGAYYLALQSTETNKAYLFDATATAIPRDFHLYVSTAVLRLSFGRDGFEAWSVHDKFQDRDIGALTGQELFEYFNPSDTEATEAGDMPDVFLLSDFDPGTVFVFDNAGQNGTEFLYPRFVNDTDTNCLQVGYRTDPAEPYKWLYAFSKTLQHNHILRTGSTNEEKVYVLVKPCKTDFLERTCCVMASECDREIQNICTRRFFRNDTDSELQLTINYFFRGAEQTEEHTLAPNEIIECTELYYVTIK